MRVSYWNEVIEGLRFVNVDTDGTTYMNTMLLGCDSPKCKKKHVLEPKHTHLVHAHTAYTHAHAFMQKRALHDRCSVAMRIKHNTLFILVRMTGEMTNDYVFELDRQGLVPARWAQQRKMS